MFRDREIRAPGKNYITTIRINKVPISAAKLCWWLVHGFLRVSQYYSKGSTLSRFIELILLNRKSTCILSAMLEIIIFLLCYFGSVSILFWHNFGEFRKNEPNGKDTNWA
jgi:hypothetical protein